MTHPSLGREDSVLSYETVTQMEGKPFAWLGQPLLLLALSPPEPVFSPQCTMLAPSSSSGPPRTVPMTTFSRSSPTSLDPVFPVSAGAGMEAEVGWDSWMGGGGRATFGHWHAEGHWDSQQRGAS